MNPYHMYPPQGAYISAPPITAPPMYPPYGLPQPPPQGVPVQRYAAPFVPVIPAPPQPAQISSPPTPSKKQEAAETTTVYVGKIPPTVEDDFIRKLLEGCGEVALWRRVTDPSSGQLKGFAFCDFKSPEGVLRALRLLNNLAIDGSNLLLKVDEKNQKVLDAYTAKRNAEQHGILIPKPGQVYQQTPDALSKEKQEDEAILANIKDLVEKQHTSLANKRAGKDDGHSNGDDRNSIVSREIRNFRERQAKENDRKDRREGDDERDRDFDRQKERDRLRLLRDREREKDARRKQRDEKDFRDREREWEHRERKKEVDREEEKKNERREKEQRAQEIIEQETEDEEYSRKKIRARDARRKRQREREDDDLDRIKEREEAEVKRREEEEKKKQEEQRQQELARIAAEELKAQNEKRRMDELQQQRVRMQQAKREAEAPAPAPVNSPPQGDEKSELRLGFTKRPKNVLNPTAGFNQEGEEEEHVVKKKRTFVPLYDDGRARKEEAQSVIDKIPTTKEDLFALPIDWTLIDKHKIADKKMRQWVSKKIVEYLGEEEKTLIDFIMSKIVAHTPPDEVLTALVPILDEEASIFVVKMWRMLVYEMYTAAKS